MDSLYGPDDIAIDPKVVDRRRRPAESCSDFLVSRPLLSNAQEERKESPWPNM